MSLRRGGRALFALCFGLTLLLAGPGQAGEPQLLPELTRAASWVVLGEVDDRSEFSQAGLVVYHVGVLDPLLGSPPSPLRVLEDRATSTEPALEPGQRVWLFLEPAPSHSFYRQQLPPGRYVSLVGGTAGVIELDEKHDALARWLVAVYAHPGTEQRDEAVRRSLRSGHTRLVADALGQWERRSDLASKFGREDLESVDVCLRSPNVSERQQARLIRLLGERKVRKALPLLRRLEPGSAAIAAARVEALAGLGEMPASDDIDDLLSHSDAKLRRLGVRQLAASSGGEGVRQLQLLALHDPDESVRIVAIEALGRAGGRDAAEVLEETFQSKDPDLRIASARALRSMEEEVAQGALENLVLKGRSYEVQRYALVLLLTVGASKEGERIQRIRREHPDDRIRKLLDEGLQPPPHPGMGPR